MKTHYQCLLFDLDGTLTDSAEGITKSVQYSAEKLGLFAPPLSALLPFVGPPLFETFQSFFGLGAEDAARAVEYYRERYVPVGMLENSVYAGVQELLHALFCAGYTLAVASSKPEPYVRQILTHFQLDSYFTFIGGSNLDGSRTEKSAVVEYVLNRLGVADKREALLIGDTHYDAEGAAQAGIDVALVAYGYGDLERMKRCKAISLFDSVQALCDYFL